jgi:hypothetical protein
MWTAILVLLVLVGLLAQMQIQIKLVLFNNDIFSWRRP